MKNAETRYLTREGARTVVGNLRWFAGCAVKIKKVSRDRFAITTNRHAWSHVALDKEDYAKLEKI
jgi:hypothetical protein